MTNMDAKVIQDARAFMRNFRNVLAFAEHIEHIGNLEGELAGVKKQYADFLVAIEEHRAMLAALADEWKAAEADIETAKNEARKIAKDAKTKADIAMTAKLRDANEISAAMVAKAKAEASAWDHRASVAKKEFEDYKGQADAKAAELEKTKAKLQDLFAGVK